MALPLLLFLLLSLLNIMKGASRPKLTFMLHPTPSPAMLPVRLYVDPPCDFIPDLSLSPFCSSSLGLLQP